MRNLHGSEKTGRIERLLRFAASFDAAEPTPDSISTRLLSMRSKPAARWTVTSRRLAPAVALAISALGLFVMLKHPRHGSYGPSNRIARNDVDLSDKRSPTPKPAVTKQDIRTALERRPIHVIPPPTPKRNTLQYRERSASIHKRSRRQSPLWRSPKVKWQVARYQRIQTGLVAAGWVAQEDDEDGTVHIAPALVEIPFAAAEISLPADGGNKHQAKQANYEEIH